MENRCYDFDPSESSVIEAARKLLWKIAESPLVDDAPKVITLGKMFRAFQRLPEVTFGDGVYVSLSSPRRMFGSHEIWHFWSITLEDGGFLEISAGGHFYRPETGGDSFTSMMWQVTPGGEPEESDYLHTLSIVDDADTFENEVEAIVIDPKGYGLETTDWSLED